MYQTEPKNASEFAGFKRVSWGAIFAGTAAALMGFFVLNLLGVGIGLSAVRVGQTGAEAAQGIGVGAGIWMGIVLIASLFFGGWVAARLAGLPFAPDSILHGVVTFSMFVIVLMVLFATGIGSAIGMSSNVLSQVYATEPGQISQALGVGQGGDQGVASEQARQTAEQIRSAAATGSILGFIGLILAGGAAVFGGLVGTPRRAPVAEVTDHPI